MINTKTCFPLFVLLLSLPINCSNTFDISGGLNSLNPKVPIQPGGNHRRSHSLPQLSGDFFTPARLDLGPFKASDGSEINSKFDGSNWNSRQDPFVTDTKRTAEKTIDQAWFPKLTNSSKYNNPRTETFSIRYNTASEDGLVEKVSLINKQNFYSQSEGHLYRRDLKLLSMAYNLVSRSTSSHNLNILHVGSGNGFVPLALALFSSNLKITSVDEDVSVAKQNVIRDGKEYFLNRLRLLSTPLDNIPRDKSGSYDLIVLSRSIDSIPGFIKDALRPGGYIIYPSESHQIKMDKLEENGRFESIEIR